MKPDSSDIEDLDSRIFKSLDRFTYWSKTIRMGLGVRLGVKSNIHAYPRPLPISLPFENVPPLSVDSGREGYAKRRWIPNN